MAKHSTNGYGKGSAQRSVNKKKFDQNFEAIFGKKNDTRAEEAYHKRKIAQYDSEIAILEAMIEKLDTDTTEH